MKILEVTTMLGCPLMCKCCPQKLLKSEYGKKAKYLAVGDFERVLDKLPKDTSIHFSGMSEPWANPKCTELLKLTLQKGFRISIFTTLYGLTEDDADVVVSLLSLHHKKVDQICLHLPDASKNMEGWRYSKQWEAVFHKFMNLFVAFRSVNTKLMTMDGLGNVHPDLAHLKIKLPNWSGHSRAGSIDGDVTVNHHTTPVYCGSTPFYDHNVLLPDGRVVLCCMDYGMKHVLGNLFTQTYDEILNGPAMQKLKQINSQTDFSKYSICKSCTVARAMET